MKSILNRIYGRKRGRAASVRLGAVMDAFSPEPRAGEKAFFTQADAILITYGDTLIRKGEPPLQTLHGFCSDHFTDVFSGIHILPFFPYSSDDGFSVTDFEAVRSDLGCWADVRTIGQQFKLMVDVVANHVSAKSQWFQSYLADEKGFADLAIEVDPTQDLSGVTRPRGTAPVVRVYQTVGPPGIGMDDLQCRPDRPSIMTASTCWNTWCGHCFFMYPREHASSGWTPLPTCGNRSGQPAYIFPRPTIWSGCSAGSLI